MPEAPDSGIVGRQVLGASARTTAPFLHRRRLLLTADGWSLEAADHRGRVFALLDVTGEPARIVVYEFAHRRARAAWVLRRLDLWRSEGMGPIFREQAEAARQWAAREAGLPGTRPPGSS